jgi:hypothetical protein
MIIFDLREEAELVSYLYVVGAIALALSAAAVAPVSFRVRLPDALADSLRPLALVFTLAAAGMVWVEYEERSEARSLVAQCSAEGCNFVEGTVSDVNPVHKITTGGRFTSPIWGGHFTVGDRFYAHYPRDHSNYSPANLLRDGDRVRICSQGERLVLVEMID